jgi:pimeloyl-ACP methyl ester carboxylesterase
METFKHNSGAYIHIDDAKIYYEEIGDKTLPPLLMLHGGLNNIEIFNDILKELPERYRVIGIDSRGHGMSTIGSCELTYQLLQKEVEKVLEHLGISELNILGFSNGGTIAYRIAAFSNLKIKKIITIGAPWGTKYVEHIIPIFSKLTVEDWKKQCPSDYESYQKLNPEANIEQLFSQVIRLALDLSEMGRPNESVKNISCDVLSIRGENDPIISNESLLELCKLVKNASMLNIPESGHEVITEQPRILAMKILSYLSY